MRDLPIFASGTLSTSTTKIAHLYELELARLKVMEAVASSTSRIIVDDIDKCFIGQKLVPIAQNQILEVTAVSLILNEIQVTPVLNSALAAETYLFETLYTTAPLPTTISSSGTDYQFPQLWHSALGTMTGRLMFTDFDLPIVAKVEDGLFTQVDACYATYIPYPIKHNGTSYDTHGRMSTVSVDVSNEGLYFSNIVLTHEALRKRRVKIYSVFLGSATEINLNVPIQVSGSIVVYPGTTSATGITGEALPSLNTPFNSAYFDAADDKVQEFEGLIDSISMSNKQATITVINYLDSTDETMLPRRLYSRGRCPFIYKDHQCRFISTLTLYSSATATATSTDLYVIDPKGKFPLFDLQPGETQMIQIDDEQMLVTAAATGTSTMVYVSEQNYLQAGPAFYEYWCGIHTEKFIYKLTVTRAYNSTTAAAHSNNAPINILLCRKTYHDCRLHYNSLLHGSFPAIPKQNFNV